MPKKATKAAAPARPTVNDTSGFALGFLAASTGPMTGGDIMAAAAAAEEIQAIFHVTRSQVYRELAKMAEAGLIKAGKPGPRSSTPYRITATGRKEFKRWMKAEGSRIVRDSTSLRHYFANDVQR